MDEQDNEEINCDIETVHMYQFRTGERWTQVIKPAYGFNGAGIWGYDLGATAVDDYLRAGCY